jgi:hypothetical protein
VCHRDAAGERLICAPMHEALQSVRHIDDLHHALLAAPGKVAFFPHRGAPGENQMERVQRKPQRRRF